MNHHHVVLRSLAVERERDLRRRAGRARVPKARLGRAGAVSFARPLANATYRRLFGAQVVSLVGSGLATVALTLLAYDLAGGNAGAIVGIALALKMVVYVFGAPVIVALVQQLPPRRVLVALDVLRALSVAGMLLATEVWHAYALIVLVSACSAGFTPTFQATVPTVLADEPSYTRALSLSRVAYELEALASPALAAALLAFISYDGLFAANAAAFLGSAALVLSTRLPTRSDESAPAMSRRRQVTIGARRFLAVPRLRALLALDLAAASASAMVIVNTVVYVRDAFGGDGGDVAWALAASGAGATIVALLLPRLLDRSPERPVMLGGGLALAAGLGLSATVDGFAALLAVWAVLGAALSAVQTPAGRLIVRAGGPAERPALFAARFSLSHACWLVTYPVAGVLGAALGLAAAAAILTALAAAAVLAASVLWRDGAPVPAAPLTARPLLANPDPRS